jgi:hypothetical protein
MNEWKYLEKQYMQWVIQATTSWSSPLFEEMLKNTDGKVSTKVKFQIKMQYKQYKIRISDPYKRAVFPI